MSLFRLITLSCVHSKYIAGVTEVTASLATSKGSKTTFKKHKINNYHFWTIPWMSVVTKNDLIFLGLACIKIGNRGKQCPVQR